MKGRAPCEIEIEGAQFVHAVALAEVWRSCGACRPTNSRSAAFGEVAHLSRGSASPVTGRGAARANVAGRLPGRYAVRRYR